jgi:hypothetical protein
MQTHGGEVTPKPQGAPGAGREERAIPDAFRAAPRAWKVAVALLLVALLERAQKLDQVFLFLRREPGAENHVEVFHRIREREQTPVMHVRRGGLDAAKREGESSVEEADCLVCDSCTEPSN